MSTKLKDLSLQSLVPENLQKDTNIEGIIAALDPEFASITQDIEKVAILSRIDELDEPTLTLLAYQFHVDFYDLAATLRMKREAVKNSLKLHMKKGTVWAIKEALRQLDIQAEFVPWWESGGEPFTFSLRAIVGGEFYRTSGRDTLIRNIYRAVEEAKSARSVLVSLHTEIRDTQDLSLYAGLIPYLYGEYSIRHEHPTLQEDTELYAGLVHLLDGHRAIGIHHELSDDGTVYAGQCMVRGVSIEIGAEYSLTHELLLRFEERIFDRMDRQNEIISTMTALIAEVADTQERIISRLDHIEKLLNWSTDDE